MIKEHEVNLFFFLNDKGFAGEAEEPNPIEEALGTQLKEDTPLVDPPKKEGEEPKPEEGEETKPKEDEEIKADIDIEGYKGKDRRGKGFGEERRKDIIEKASNLDLDFEYGHGDKKTKKVPFSEIKQTLKWMQDNSEQIAAGLSMNKYASQYPQFGKLMNAVIGGSFNEKNEFNAAFTEKITKAIEAKEEEIEEKTDAVDEEIAKLQKILDDGDIDPDSPQAEVLKSNLVSMKAMKSQLGIALSKLDGATKKIGDIEKSQSTATETNTKTEHAAEVKRIAGLFSGEMETLTDKEKKDGYKFVADSEAARFDALVRAGVGNSVAALKLPKGQSITDEQFIKLVRENAKSSYEAITKEREAIEQSYIKRKGLKPKDKKEGEEEIPELKEDMNIGDLTETVQSLLPK